MDQVKAFAKVVWEQRFWVLSALGTIIVLVTWMSATGSLESDFNTRKSAIDGKFTQMSELSSKPVHPNEQVIEEEKAQARRQREYVLEVWQSLYERQREEVLYWPKDDVLEENFVNYIERRKFRDPIQADMRDIYRNYIGNRFDGLVEIVQALKIPDTGTLGGRGAGRGRGEGRGREGYGGEGYGGEGYAAVTLPDGAEDQDYLVLWLDQDKVRDQLAFDRRPTSTQIWVTQEDLWVYESLLNMIARTNEERGATRPDNAAIKAIVSLDIGRDANAGGATDKGQVMLPRSAAGAGDGFGGGRGEAMMERGGERGFEGGMGPEGGGGYGREGFGEGRGDGTSPDEGLLAFRYLDGEGKPIPGEVESFGTEFRQLPVRMVLMMDQRWIPQLLIEASNAPLPLEVKQVRLNPSKAMSLTGGGREGGGGGFGRRGRGGAMMPNISGLTSDPAVAEVEIRGAIYIYNEPDPNQLEVPGAEDDDGQFAAMD